MTEMAFWPSRKGAEFSGDRIYRYALWRIWGEGRRRLVVVGLNPSTADESIDDPTIRRCIGFAKREMCDSLIMLNLFAFRSTWPEDLKKAADPIGPDNDTTIHRHGWGDEVVVLAAWGAYGGFRDRARQVAETLPAMKCLGLTANGQPRHPLYVRADAPFLPYSKSAK